MSTRLQHRSAGSVQSLRRWPVQAGLVSLAIGAMLLQACSGGGGASASSGGAATINGTVTGFGSVMVDGVEVEDAYARIAHENADGSLSSDVLQLGQRVRLSHDGAGRASQVLIDAAVIGQASSIDTVANTLTVAGQSVLVNINSASGPLTVFGGGYTSLSDIQVNDLVQVHGTPVYDTVSQRYQVQATRIQKDSGVARVQINGQISSYATTTGGASFALNGLTVSTTAGTSIRPSGSTLADGLQVTAYGTSLSGSMLNATHIRVNKNQNSGDTTMQAQLSGLVSAYDSVAGTFTVQGTTIRLGTLTPPANLANNAYVMVKGSVGTDGIVTAGSINVRTSDTSTALAQVQLIGPISDFVDSSSFIVRGVPVDAHTATLANCTGTPPLAEGVTVRVQASQQAGTAVVLATSVSCQPAPATLVIRPAEGTVASVDAANKLFTLTLSSSMTLPNATSPVTSLSVQWNDTTTFAGTGLSADTLSGKAVHVEGYLNGSNLVARVIQLDDGSNNAPKMDGDGFRRARSGGATPQGWQTYRHH